MKWIVIGIGGTTCSGKTTLATKLQQNIKDSILINQDSYFLPVNDQRHVLIPELNHLNWEILSSLDMSKMYSDVTKIIESNDTSDNISTKENYKYLILEGFLLYNCKPIADLCQLKYFLDISKELSKNRRSKKTYDPADVPGYFDKVVWPEYLKHKSLILADENLHKNIKFLDGSKNVDESLDKIINDIKML